MKKRWFFRFWESAVFLVLLVCILSLVSGWVERKASTIEYEPFLQDAQEFDVLFIGDSHMYNSVFPMELWRDYGIASYNIACYGNTIPVSYWSMMNALDYAKPKLMVIGIKDVEKNYKLTGSSGDVHTALDAYPLSRTKVRAIEDLMNDPYAVDDDGNRYIDLKWEYYFKLGKYHSRWSEISKSDIFVEANCQKGAGMVIGVAQPDDYEITDAYAEENGWGYVYLRRMIEECRKRGIEVLLTQLPFPADDDDQRQGNLVGYIAEEYGVNYIDFVNMDQVADYYTDCYDPSSHLNPSGARKTTDYLGQYIMDHYDIPDRSKDPAYAHWELDYDVYEQYKLGHIAAQKKLENVLMLLHDESFSAVVRIKEDSPLYDDDTLMTLMHNIAREHVYEKDLFSKWSGSIFPLEGLDEAAWDAQAYSLIVDRSRGEISEFVGSGQKIGVDASFGFVSDENGEGITLTRQGEEHTYFSGDSGSKPVGVSILVISDRTGMVAAELSF